MNGEALYEMCLGMFTFYSYL